MYQLYLTGKLLMHRRLGTWAVAKLVPGTNQIALEGPVCNGGQVLGWHTKDGRRRFRRFHVGMSGFAFNSTILWDSKNWRRPTLKPIRQLDTVKEEFQVSVLLFLLSWRLFYLIFLCEWMLVALYAMYTLLILILTIYPKVQRLV